MRRCWVNWMATCSFKVRIEMIGRLGSTEAMAWRTCAMGRLAPGRVTMTMSCRKCEPGLRSVDLVFRRKVVLRFGQKKERTNRLVEFESQIAGVFGDAHNLVFALRSDIVLAEVFSDGIFILEEFSRKRSLMTATCREAAVSCSEMPRPLRIGFPMTSK